MYERVNSSYDCVFVSKYVLKAKNKVQNAK